MDIMVSAFQRDSAAGFAVAAVQMVSTLEVTRNLACAQLCINQAAAAGAQLVVLPEYFYCMGQLETDKLQLAETLGSGPIQDFLAAQAAQHQIWLVGGTLPLHTPEPGHVFNTTLVFDPSGQRIARYDKIHLFSFENDVESFNEARTIYPGAAAGSFDAPFGRVGLAICYDLRFPELFRRLGDCALMIVPSAFTETTGRAHWEILLRARAIENQCYVLAAAQGGHHENGRRTWGHSMLIDPWGEILGQCATGTGVVIGSLDVARQQAVRNSLPAWRHRVL